MKLIFFVTLLGLIMGVLMNLIGYILSPIKKTNKKTK